MEQSGWNDEYHRRGGRQNRNKKRPSSSSKERKRTSDKSTAAAATTRPATRRSAGARTDHHDGSQHNSDVKSATAGKNTGAGVGSSTRKNNSGSSSTRNTAFSSSSSSNMDHDFDRGNKKDNVEKRMIVAEGIAFVDAGNSNGGRRGNNSRNDNNKESTAVAQADQTNHEPTTPARQQSAKPPLGPTSSASEPDSSSTGLLSPTRQPGAIRMLGPHQQHPKENYDSSSQSVSTALVSAYLVSDSEFLNILAMNEETIALQQERIREQESQLSDLRQRLAVLDPESVTARSATMVFDNTTRNNSGHRRERGDSRLLSQRKEQQLQLDGGPSQQQQQSEQVHPSPAVQTQPRQDNSLTQQLHEATPMSGSGHITIGRLCTSRPSRGGGSGIGAEQPGKSLSPPTTDRDEYSTAKEADIEKLRKDVMKKVEQRSRAASPMFQSFYPPTTRSMSSPFTSDCTLASSRPMLRSGAILSDDKHETDRATDSPTASRSTPSSADVDHARARDGLAREVSSQLPVFSQFEFRPASAMSHNSRPPSALSQITITHHDHEDDHDHRRNNARGRAANPIFNDESSYVNPPHNDELVRQLSEQVGQETGLRLLLEILQVRTTELHSLRERLEDLEKGDSSFCDADGVDGRRGDILSVGNGSGSLDGRRGVSSGRRRWRRRRNEGPFSTDGRQRLVQTFGYVAVAFVLALLLWFSNRVKR